MEIKKNENSISIINRSKKVLQIIVEFIHYVEEIDMGSEFTIRVIANENIDIASIFGIEYNDDNLAVLLNNNIRLRGNYKVSFLLNGEVIYEQVL